MKIKSNKGLVGTDISISIIIAIVFIAIITMLFYQIGTANIETERQALVTNYAVDLLEQIALMPYDEFLTTELNETWYEAKGIQIPEQYHVSIEKKSNPEKDDLLKEVTVTVGYEEKNVTITTLKTRW